MNDVESLRMKSFFFNRAPKTAPNLEIASPSTESTDGKVLSEIKFLNGSKCVLDRKFVTF